MTTATRTAARHFYGLHWAYGINTVDSNGDPIATPIVFDTKAERDAWVDEDRFDGNFHRSATTAAEARRLMVPEIIATLGLGVYEAADLRVAGMDTIIAQWNRMWDMIGN